MNHHKERRDLSPKGIAVRRVINECAPIIQIAGGGGLAPRAIARGYDEGFLAGQLEIIKTMRAAVDNLRVESFKTWNRSP